MTDYPAYEDSFGPLGRRLRRAARAGRWLAKGTARKPRTILVETRWRLGDEIMALPIYEALKARYPGARVEALCNYPELLEDNPFVDAINPADPSPDRYLLLRGAPRDAHRLAHYARTARLPEPAARPRLYYTDWGAPTREKPYVAVSAGASWAVKRWPVARWRGVCRELESCGIGVVELGVEGDERIGVGRCLVGETTIREAACALRHARLYMGCDSGLMHLALAADTQTLALFGPTDPGILIRDEPLLSVITTARPCRGCWNRPARGLRNAAPSGGEKMDAPGVCPLHLNSCMEDIAVADVTASLRSLLGVEG